MTSKNFFLVSIVTKTTEWSMYFWRAGEPILPKLDLCWIGSQSKGLHKGPQWDDDKLKPGFLFGANETVSNDSLYL